MTPDGDRRVSGDLEAPDSEFRDLTIDDAAWASAFPVLRQLRPHLERDELDAIQRAGRTQGLTFTGAFVAGTCVGVAGWRVMDTTSVIRKLYVDDLVTDTASRSMGVGSILLAHLSDRAVELGCTHLELDSGHRRVDAHRFYVREGFTDVSRHFRRPTEGRPAHTPGGQP
jgi:GNAT superfamily N-acetyltransferase